MSDTSDDEIVVTDGRTTTERSRVYRWLLDHLAKFPGRVTVVTFAAGVVVTVLVVVVDGDSSPTTVVSLIATLWALFFAVMIYLLTARDTDKVLEQIADLHEQLATALAAPDESEAESIAESAEPSDGAAAPPPVIVPPTGGRGDVGPGDRTRDSGRQRPPAPGGGNHRPALIVGAPAIVEAVPKELLDSWTSATGRTTGDLSRAWTRDPRSDRQWVLETTGGGRWVVFSKGARGVGVMSLDDRRAGRGWRGPAS